MTQETTSFVLAVTCPDKIGIVADVAGFLRDQDYFIDESAHFGDRDTERFFMRTVFTPRGKAFTQSGFVHGFARIAERFEMSWQVHDSKVLPRVLIMVSRADHCLSDILYRYRTGALHMCIPAIVSNHMDLAGLAEWHKIPYFHIPVAPDTKTAAEARLRELIKETQADLVVLARYMQVLSNALCDELPGRMINIHHSFLPGFEGPKPYHRAYERGVKLIGATAHYVTPDLDEGPIIEQQVERVDHSQSPEALAAIGRDVESITLSRALRYHLQYRVFLNGKKTVVFR